MAKSPKKKKILFFIPVFFIAVAVFCFVMAVSSKKSSFVVPQPLSPEKVLTADEVTADRDRAIYLVKNIHPYFLLEDDKTEYEAAKKRYLETARSEMTVRDFQIATSEFLCFFGDGHTGIRWDEKEHLYVPWDYKDDGLYLVENERFTNKRVVSVAGFPIEKIFETIDKIRPAENEMASVISYVNLAQGKNLLEVMGMPKSSDAAEVIFSDGSAITYKFSTKNPNQQSTESTSASSNTTNNSCRFEGDIFVIDFNTCVDNAELKSIAKKLKKAIDGGTTKVIIDARGNGGGDSNAPKRLLEAMGMKTPEYDMFIRYSPEAAKQNGYKKTSGSYHHEGKSKGKPNDKINLVVLCDRDTFSSATMLLVWVRDGKLGTIIGEPSSNMPSNYGDIIYFSLENSHIWGIISHKRFIRPDRDNKERMLIPDIRCLRDNAFDEAVKFLNGK